MQSEVLRSRLDDPAQSAELLASLRLTDAAAGHHGLLRMHQAGAPLEVLGGLCDRFRGAAATLADPDMAWNNLQRFVCAAPDPASTAALLQSDAHAAPDLLLLFSSSQYLSDLLVQDPAGYEALRATDGRPVARQTMVEEAAAELAPLADAEAAMAALRRIKRRETLRIAFGDLVRGQPVSAVTRQVSLLADAILEAAVGFQRAELERAFGVPRDAGGQPARFCVLGLGKLGGVELNYSSDVDLIFFYGTDGQTDGGRSIANREFFERLSRGLIRLLGESTDLGAAYRVDLRLRPDGARGAVCMSRDQMVAYYDRKGRTWERQAYIKARPVAGDLPLGEGLLRTIEPWVYRRYLGMADIAGIRALRRRIEHGEPAGPARAGGGAQRNVKTGRGGIRDIEFVIQFLQLLNGGALPEVRTGNTLEAIARLEEAGCLTHQERTLLEDNYNALRKLEHRLQIMFDTQTHTLPASEAELEKVAVRMGHAAQDGRPARVALTEQLQTQTDINRRILDHLLHDAFDADPEAEPEVDLVNDPDPPAERIAQVLGRHALRDTPAAYANLMELATEKIRFLSTRRCRHFLASIAPRLLRAIAATPDPDSTLRNLARVSDSIGGKAALWELFSVNRPSLNLYVTLCAACPYLAGTLTSNPGMIDELMDSLLVDQLPTGGALRQTLADLTRGAEDAEPILHSFKNAQHLRVGVRDILGKDDIRATHAALSDTAEACLKQIAADAYGRLVGKFGTPVIGPPPAELQGADPDRFEQLRARVGEPCELVILALGKLGGREPNYHSDLDLIFCFEAEGATFATGRDSGRTTSNGHFFSELGQRIIKAGSKIGPYGRLYEIDPRLRPTGKNGPLAVSFDTMQAYFRSGRGQLWERQALCKARAITGTAAAAERAMAVVSQAAFGPAWRPEHAGAIRRMRLKLEASATDRNLKKGPGGTMDTEFVVQMLQLRHGGADPSVRTPGTLAAIEALAAAGHLAADDADYFAESYRFQRSVEARIRLMDHQGRHELPTDDADLRKLAFLLGYAEPQRLRDEAARFFAENRERFSRLFDAAETG
ncbi:MAG: bifunctional [glutamate--ammonia ligase]-adenylyl-L-tyrosine phosphorylase/[glutamate--ammonia-ligase] adenylyltransferase [Planctomycetota bacterium]